MDFMERWFGLSPDGGNGLYELCLVVLLGVAVALVIRRLRASARSGNRRSRD